MFVDSHLSHLGQQGQGVSQVQAPLQLQPSLPEKKKGWISQDYYYMYFFINDRFELSSPYISY